MNFIFRLGDAPGDKQLGGKAAALAALQGCGVLIPEWFVLLPHAFESSLSEADRHALSEQEHRVENERLLARIKLAPKVMQELREALAKLSPAGELVAVRSSALDEDDPDHSFAGQLESFLSVHPDEVAAKVVAVWKSAFGSLARAYRERHQLPRASRPPAVLIQRMIHAEVCRRGIRRGSHFWPSGPRGCLRRARPGHRPGERREQRGHMACRCIPAKLSKGRSQINRPFSTTREFAPWRHWCDGPERFLAGPRTSNGPSRAVRCTSCNRVRSPRRPRAGPLNIWDNSNIIESYSGVTTPLTFSFARRAYEGVYRQFCRMLAVPKSEDRGARCTFRQMLGLIRGEFITISSTGIAFWRCCPASL